MEIFSYGYSDTCRRDPIELLVISAHAGYRLVEKLHRIDNYQSYVASQELQFGKELVSTEKYHSNRAFSASG